MEKSLNLVDKKSWGSEYVSSQIWCYLIWGGVMDLGSKIKVAQNSLKHILVLEFLRSDEMFEIL